MQADSYNYDGAGCGFGIEANGELREMLKAVSQLSRLVLNMID